MSHIYQRSQFRPAASFITGTNNIVDDGFTSRVQF